MINPCIIPMDTKKQKKCHLNDETDIIVDVFFFHRLKCRFSSKSSHVFYISPISSMTLQRKEPVSQVCVVWAILVLNRMCFQCMCGSSDGDNKLSIYPWERFFPRCGVAVHNDNSVAQLSTSAS
jgi:hypothetical protein